MGVCMCVCVCVCVCVGDLSWQPDEGRALREMTVNSKRREEGKM